MRPLALAGASGGLTSIVARLFWDSFSKDFAVDPETSCRPVFFEDHKNWFEIHWPSLLLGVLIGFALGPVIEVLCVVRQIWSLQLRAHFRVQGAGTRDSYKVIG